MKKAIKKLDQVFSEYIRLRDADKNGICKCISCGHKEHWKEVDNGHYIDRRHMSTRFNEKNCNAQCVSCNRFKQGNIPEYSKGLIYKYGPGTSDDLEALKFQTQKYSKFEIEDLIKDYKEKVKVLIKEKR